MTGELNGEEVGPEVEVSTSFLCDIELNLAVHSTALVEDLRLNTQFPRITNHTTTAVDVRGWVVLVVRGFKVKAENVSLLVANKPFVLYIIDILNIFVLLAKKFKDKADSLFILINLTLREDDGADLTICHFAFPFILTPEGMVTKTCMLNLNGVFANYFYSCFHNILT